MRNRGVPRAPLPLLRYSRMIRQRFGKDPD